MELVQLSNFPFLSLCFALFFISFHFFCQCLFSLCSNFQHRRLFSVLFCFQYIIFTLNSQSNYMFFFCFILNHHYQIGSVIICSIWQYSVHFGCPIALAMCMVCLCMDWKLEILKKLHRLLLRVSQFCCCRCFCYCIVGCWEGCCVAPSDWLTLNGIIAFSNVARTLWCWSSSM